MFHHRPAITTTYGFPPPEAQPISTSEHKANLAAAGREAAQREMALNRALSRAPAPKVKPPPALRGPVLPPDFVQRADALDEAIYQKGIAINRERLVSLGKTRFEELRELDRTARSLQRVIISDLTSWPSVASAFMARNALSAPVRRRRIAEQLSGAGEDRERAGTINGIGDLWKANQEPVSVKNVYRFYDAFASLILGQSMLERLSPDGRLRSHSFCGAKTGYVKDWLSALEGEHFIVALVDPLSQILAWLCAEKTRLPESMALARECFNVRSPSSAQIRIAHTLWHGFLLGHSSWELWNYVGSRTRTLIDVEHLDLWRKELVKRYPAIAQFHDTVSSFFWQEVGGNVYDAHLQFDATGYRRFIDRSMQELLYYVSVLLGLATDKMLPGTTVARFEGSVIVEANDSHRAFLKHSAHSIVGLQDLIGENFLEPAFPGHIFPITIEEVQS